MSGSRKGKKILVTVLLVILGIIIALGITFLVLYQSGKKQFHKNDTQISTSSVIDGLDIDEDSLTYNGKDYTLNKDIVSILVMGIDKEDLSDNRGIGVNGQADAIFVAAINTSTKKIKLIPIQRESMVENNVFSENGKYEGVNTEQICLAYAYGKDAEKSCENVKVSVSRLLMGINISSYVAIDLKGVGDLTTKIGGITLDAIEPVYYRGSVCNIGDRLILKGDDARAYIRSRTDDLDGSTKRLARQKQFLSVFASTAGNQIMNDFTKLKVYYDGIMPYVQTDLSFAQVSYLATSCITRDIGGLFEYESIDGEMRQNGEYAEYYPDKESLINVILNTFYTEK